jgi:hypothetical protein
MTISKQLVNALGLLVVVAVLLAGGALVALPLLGQSRATDAAVSEIAQTNGIYASQVAQLTEDEERLPAITASLEELRAEIAVLPTLDDVHELVVDSAAASGAVVISVVAAEPASWTPRTAVGPLSQTEGAATPAADVATADEEAPAAADSVDSAVNTEGGSQDAPATGGAQGLTPAQQIPVTITVELLTATQAALFIEGLGGGPRLLGIDTAVLTDEEEVLTLTVTALAFIRTED